MPERMSHNVVRMTGRDPHESGRAATPLELLFDLTFVIAFGTAAGELAHFLAAGYVWEGVLGFAFAIFAVSWAWINFAWFASAYDTDDWLYRLTTMVQMVGVLILALGLPQMFESLHEGDHVDNGVMVLGYIVMRVPMILQWWRASRQDPERTAVCRTFIVTLVISQAGWIVLALAPTSIPVTFVLIVLLILIEATGPLVAERMMAGTPWHPHHIAERYGLLVIIALGEGLIGTVATLSAIIGEEGWTVDVAALGIAGVGVTFGMWWTYFTLPGGDLLHAHRERSFAWGYGHIPVFGALVAVGAGLHAAAYRLEEQSALSDTETVLTVVVPLAAYVGLLYALYALLTRTFDPFHLLLVLGSAAVLAVGVAMVAAGASLTWSLLVVALTPWVTVVGYETIGHRHNEDVLSSL
ncbi:low temperature requirement protein A [Nocardioides endophyticus]|uniref:Low temperature requirement protein A n=1 Tax=Nocardioides endophyticus TaxID=1353775 RepID=A0ABP8Z7R4_9ACTN